MSYPLPMRACLAAMLLVACGGSPDTQSDAATDAVADSVATGDGAEDAAADADSSSAGDAGLAYLHAVGATLVDGSGKTVRLHGVNRSGTEYACIQGWSIFDGPSDDASLASIAGWKANAVRIPLNEDCWLGINGVKSQYSGATYQQAISDYADRVLAHGMYPIIELHWSAPGTTPAVGQQPMPDQDHSITFWTQVATAYAGRPNTILEIFNEPYPDNNQDTAAAWTCWRDGGTCANVTYQVAGMATLLAAVRNAGAPNLVLMGGVQYSNSLTQWLAHAPVDPQNNIGAAWHVYNFNACSDASCYDTTAGVVAKSVPIVTTEIGEDDCAGGFVTTLMTWLDTHQQNYLAWTWNTWGSCLSLIGNYDGTAAGTYGTTFKTHLAGL